MESYEVIREAIDKVGAKAVASELGVSLSLVYKWAQPNVETGSGSRNPLDRIARLMSLSQERKIIKWLCEQSGGYFLRNPASSCTKGYEVMPSTNVIVQQFADLLAVITQAAADNRITDEESEDIRAVWDDLKSFTEGFVRCCEEGDFQPIEAGLASRRN